eukprot:TRINITY_DN68068_c3_g1_i13.p1 TRINITY_DN68068_c3_g1~~TRINITY_DN68068_c3_g1_i13.p1  ORF type:complete len:166 (-),score=9.21 TRINITY_DN68068_c3_g1_i13:23-454(-)
MIDQIEGQQALVDQYIAQRISGASGQQLVRPIQEQLDKQGRTVAQLTQDVSRSETSQVRRMQQLENNVDTVKTNLETEFRRMISEQQAARAGTNQQVDHLLHWKDQFNRGLQAVWREISLLSNLLKVTATIKKSSKPFIRGCT